MEPECQTEAQTPSSDAALQVLVMFSFIRLPGATHPHRQPDGTHYAIASTVFRFDDISPLTAMRNQLFWILPIAAFALLFVMRGPAMFSFFNSASAQTSATAALNQTTFQELMQQGAILVDVRTSGEFAGGHMRNAVNIPVDVINGATAQLGATDRPVILYCRSGNRSGQAARILRSLGYTRVHDIQVAHNW